MEHGWSTSTNIFLIWSHPCRIHAFSDVQVARELRNTKNLVRPSDFLIVDDATVSTFLIYRLGGRPDGRHDGRHDGLS